MSIGDWDPSTQSSTSRVTLEPALLRRLVDLGSEDTLAELESSMSDEDKAQHAIMQAAPTAWEQALVDYSDDELLALIRFFTVAEMKLPQWEGGAQSPVISINRILKGRGNKLDKDMLLWIKANSDNRFIPNGSPL